LAAADSGIDATEPEPVPSSLADAETQSSEPVAPVAPVSAASQPKHPWNWKGEGYDKRQAYRERQAAAIAAAIEAERLAQVAADAADAEDAATEATPEYQPPKQIVETVAAATPIVEPIAERFVGFDEIVEYVPQVPVDWVQEEAVFDSHGNALMYRGAARIKFLLPFEINESIQRGLNSEEQRADLEAFPVRLVSALTLRRLENDQQRMARKGRPRDPNPVSWVIHTGGGRGSF